jgi:imidazolonepropionase-like amidohydrolase
MRAGLQALRDAGVVVGFGTDLLGPLETHQRLEFAERAAVYSPVEILRQATSVNARILRHEGLLGCIKPGAWADMIVVEGDPLQDIRVLSDAKEPPPVIVKAGVLMHHATAIVLSAASGPTEP